MANLVADPLFSIIVPTRNVESTIAACLGSIARQTCLDYEVVVLDAGSQDRTLAIVAEHEPQLAGRLSTHVGQDEGTYDAMNRGVALARGQWLLFLGADDSFYQDDVLARIAVFLGQNPSCHLAHGDVVMRSDGSRYGGVFTLDTLLFERNICHQAVFYRRELFAQLGPYNLRYRIWADWDFNIRCFSNPALVARHVDIVVANYNDTGGLSRKEDPELQKRLPLRFLSGFAWRWAGHLSKAAKSARGILRRRGRRPPT